jgi:hypothetical protein
MTQENVRWIVESDAEGGKPPRMMRIGRGLKNMDRDFDVAFWQAQDTSARMQAAWELVEHYLKQRGRASELRLQRNVVRFRLGKRT